MFVLAINMKCGAFWFYALSQLVVVVFSSSSVSIQDEVQALKAQVKSLEQIRLSDHIFIHESLSRISDKNLEISDLKKEIRDLK